MTMQSIPVAKKSLPLVSPRATAADLDIDV